MNQSEKILFKLIQYSLEPDALKGEECTSFAREYVAEKQMIDEELRTQTVDMLPCALLDHKEPQIQRLYADHLKGLGTQISRWHSLMMVQQEVLTELRSHEIPAVVLKGAAAACYYPRPEYRRMGDIDLLVKPEDFERAASCISDLGFRLEDTGNERHVQFFRDRFEVELHRKFSSSMNEEQNAYLDQLLYDGISRYEWQKIGDYDYCRLPSVENGLVLLGHINQHLYSGLGLRQMIDWMEYVKAELDEDAWETFALQAEKIGMKKLALVVTRMCQMYLGLSQDIKWCKGADDSLCEELMLMTLRNGNFGRKDAITMKTKGGLGYFGSPVHFFSKLQKSGTLNWKWLEKHPNWKPFAWLYQLCRLTYRFFSNSVSLKDIKNAGKDKTLLEKLEVTRW